MAKFNDLARECLSITKEEYISNEKVNVIGAKYFVLLENDEMRESDFDPILNQSDIKLAFVFPKIHYTPMSNWYNSYLQPIIINKNFEAIVGKLKIQDWKFEFTGQPLQYTPNGLGVNLVNVKFGFNEHIGGAYDKFSELYKFLIILTGCSSKSEVLYVFDIYKKSLKIDSLSEYVSRLEADSHIKSLTIDSYKELLDSIAELVNSKE